MTNPANTRNTAIREQIMGQINDRWSVQRLYRNWKARRQIKRLQDREGYILDDIGVTRDEISWASHLPLTVNSALALEDRAYRRRKEQRHMWL